METIPSSLALTLILYVGFALLALSQDRNWRIVDAAALPKYPARVILRVAGFTLLGLALVSAVLCNGASFGALLWGT